MVFGRLIPGRDSRAAMEREILKRNLKRNRSGLEVKTMRGKTLMAARVTVIPRDAAQRDSVPPQSGHRLLDQIGNTPLLKIERVAAEFPNVEFYAKAEWFNPGGSVKDRAAYAMIRDGERSGQLRPGKIILDATSGNTGIALGMIGAALGYRVKLCLPTSASPERKAILNAYGVDVVFTPGEQGTDGAIRRVREIYGADPE